MNGWNYEKTLDQLTKELETVLRSDLNPMGFALGILNDVDESGHYEIPARYTAKGDAPYSSNVQFVGDTETP